MAAFFLENSHEKKRIRIFGLHVLPLWSTEESGVLYLAEQTVGSK